jgi:hypothetical protein
MVDRCYSGVVPWCWISSGFALHSSPIAHRPFSMVLGWSGAMVEWCDGGEVLQWSGAMVLDLVRLCPSFFADRPSTFFNGARVEWCHGARSLEALP